MKLRSFAIFSLIGLCFTGACHKAAPVVARTPEPIQAAAAEKTSAASPSSGAAALPGPPVKQNPRSGITSEERKVLNDRLAHLEDALFDYDKSTIRADAASVLKDDVGVIHGILQSYPSEKLRIEGHCDERGSDEYNLALGDKRAQAVAEFFETLGISSAQLTVISYGKDKPVCTDQTEDCFQKNRRAHIVAQN
jgi:peptidoglycan-associated lipoprotein